MRRTSLETDALLALCLLSGLAAPIAAAIDGASAHGLRSWAIFALCWTGFVAALRRVALWAGA